MPPGTVEVVVLGGRSSDAGWGRGDRWSSRADAEVPDPSRTAATTTIATQGRQRGIPNQIDHGA